jgi:hypothetical protein
MNIGLVTALTAGTALTAQDSSSSGQRVRAEPAPLFASTEPLNLTIRAPFKTLFDNRDDDAPEQPATLTYEGSDGNAVTTELTVELRGHNRRRKRVCNFPPIRLDFPRKEMVGTLFEGQNRLKLVTHCQSSRDQYEQYVLMEYAVYRSLNALTDLSFRVRLANITYEDSEGERDPITKVAFLIEDDDALAARNGWEVLEIPQIPHEYVEPLQLNLIEVFQYMIGHTDWSAFQGQPGEDKCCHNGRLIGSLQGPVFPVPYDFDFAGIIDARYAEVAEQLGLRSVRQRLYRGLCRDESQLMETIELFKQKKDDVYRAFQEQPGLEERQINKAVDYLDDFYETLDNEGRIRREFVKPCRR